MTYAESAASAQLAVKMVTTKLGGNSKSKSKSAKSITVPSYFLDRLNNATVSREYPTVTSFNGRAFDKKRFLDEIVNFRDLLLQHPEFQGKVTNYCCNFVDANEHSSGMIEQYLNSFCIPTTDILFDDPQEAKRLHYGHLQLLQEYFQQNDEFKIQLPTSKQTQLAIIQPEYDHETAAYQDHLYNQVLKTYGKLIYQQLPDFNPFTEANNTVAAYYLIDFASDVIPATTVFPLPNYRECSIPHYGKVSERPSNVNAGEQWHTVASSSRSSATINPVTNLSDPDQVNQFVVLSQLDDNGTEMISEPTQQNLQTQVLDSQDSNMDTDADYDPMQNSSEDEYSDSTENIQSDDNQL
ncbi:hypothetical protein B5S32_g5754 [[Candida] boidinii]|nr:hypothetical protein B5S32_g5754 [[Candida] boidinii]